MSEPRQEILRLLAEGRITSFEAEMLIDALEEGLLTGHTKADLGEWRRGDASARKTPRHRAGPGAGAHPSGRRAKTAEEDDSSSKAPEGATTRRRNRSSADSGSKVRKPPDDGREIPGSSTHGADKPRRRMPTEAGASPDRPGRGIPAGRSPDGGRKQSDLDDKTDVGADDASGGDVLTGIVWELPAGSTLRVGPPRDGVAMLTGLGLRGVSGNQAVLYRGAGAELRAAEAGCYELMWHEGILIMDIPADLGGLEIGGIQGKVTLLHYAGPFAIEGVAGSLSVGSIRSPFRIRKIGGDVDLGSLSLAGGLSTIAEVAGDVRVRATREASFTVRASSLSGQVAFGKTIAVDSGESGRRRGVWRLGAGAGQLNITGVKGWIRLFQDPDIPEDG